MQDDVNIRGLKTFLNIQCGKKITFFMGRKGGGGRERKNFSLSEALKYILRGL